MKKASFGFLLLALGFATAAHAVDFDTKLDNFTIGNPANTTTDKIFKMNTGGGAANPKIKWNYATSKLQFSNDGSSFRDFGSGGGNALSLLSDFNGDFEGGTTNWTASGGTFISGTTAANLLAPGKAYGSWDSSAAAQTLSSVTSTITANDGISGQGVTGGFYLKCATGTCTHVVEIFDGTNILNSKTIVTTTTSYTANYIIAIAPLSGSLILRLKSVNSNEPIVLLKNAYLGRSDGFNLAQIAQAQYVGALKFPGATSCNWTTTTASFTDFATVSACNSATVTGPLTSPGKVLQVTTPVVAGEYDVTFYGLVRDTTSAAEQCRIIDDLGTVGGSIGPSVPATYSPMTLPAHFSYTTSGTRTFKFQCATGGTIMVVNDVGGFTGLYAEVGFIIHQFPNASQSAYRVDTSPASWTGYMQNSGAGTTTSASYVDITNTTSQTLTPLTNINFGSVSLAASQVGLSIGFPRLGTYRICAYGNIGSSTTGIQASARMVDGAGTIINPGMYNQSQNGASMVSICGKYVATSLAATTIKLQAAASGGTTSVGGISGPASNPSFFWEIDQTDMPGAGLVFPGAVLSANSAPERIERARIPNGCASITSQTGSWLTLAASGGTGTCNLTIAAGVFASAPSCIFQVAEGNLSFTYSEPPTTTALTIYSHNGSTLVNRALSVICMGPH